MTAGTPAQHAGESAAAAFGEAERSVRTRSAKSDTPSCRFERLHLLGDGRLGDVPAFRRFAEGFGLGGHDEGPEELLIDHHSLTISLVRIDGTRHFG